MSSSSPIFLPPLWGRSPSGHRSKRPPQAQNQEEKVQELAQKAIPPRPSPPIPLSRGSYLQPPKADAAGDSAPLSGEPSPEGPFKFDSSPPPTSRAAAALRRRQSLPRLNTGDHSPPQAAEKKPLPSPEDVGTASSQLESIGEPADPPGTLSPSLLDSQSPLAPVRQGFGYCSGGDDTD